MKTYSCYSCDKEFKNSRSLASHNYKFHSSAQSQATRQVNDFKDDDTSLRESISTAKVTKPGAATISETLVELKALIGSLQKEVQRQEDKIEDLDNHVVKIYSTGITGIENKLEKVTNAVRVQNERFFEDMVYDTLLIRTLLRARGSKTVENRIPELKNATLALSQAFEFDWKQTLLLKKISSASFVDTKEILKENLTEVKDIFSSLPSGHELETVIRGSDAAYTDENGEPDNENTESSATTEDTQNNSQERKSQYFSDSSSEEDE